MCFLVSSINTSNEFLSESHFLVFVSLLFLRRNGQYVKDMSRMGRELKKIIILDVRVESMRVPSIRFVSLEFAKFLCFSSRKINNIIMRLFRFFFQPENAIPIESWFDDPDDNELHQLIPILEALAKVRLDYVYDSILKHYSQHRLFQVDDIPKAIRNSIID